jgi:precorrin-6x reductase
VSDLTDAEAAVIRDSVVEVCAALQAAGIACVIVTAGRGFDRCAYLDSTAPFAHQMLTNALKATRERNARMAN